jgi:hypothetical protein
VLPALTFAAAGAAGAAVWAKRGWEAASTAAAASVARSVFMGSFSSEIGAGECRHRRPV